MYLLRRLTTTFILKTTHGIVSGLHSKRIVTLLASLLFLLTFATPRTKADVLVDSSASGGSVCCLNATGSVNAGSSHTVGNGTNRLLIAGISIISAAGTTPPLSSGATWTVSSVVQNMNYVGSAVDGNTRVDIFVLVNPNSGSGTVSISFNGSYVGYKMGSVSYTGVDQRGPVGALVSSTCANITSSQSCSINVPTSNGSRVFPMVTANTTSGFTTAATSNFWGPTTGGCSNCNSGGNSAFTYQGADYISTNINSRTLTALTSNGSASATNNFAIGAVNINPASASAQTGTGGNSQTRIGNTTVTFSNVSGSGSTTATAIDPNASGPAPSGYSFCTDCPAYDISTTATYTPPVTVCITAPNVSSTSNLKLLHFETSSWIDRTVSVNPSTKTVCGNVNSLSPFAVAQAASPTAASGTISGQIMTSAGAPISGVTINLSGAQSRKTITDENGYYRFTDVETGGFYTLSPEGANYSFSPATRSFSQLGNATEAAFTATPNSGIVRNPIDTPDYFVRQHYLDFLGREPDESGFNFWSDQISSCGSDTSCRERRTINVSAAYFQSIEFQQTGGLVDGLYRASYGRAPRYAEFMPDTETIAAGVIVNGDGWQQRLASNKSAFIDAFVNRAAFHAAYDGLTNNDYVAALISHTSVSFNDVERAALVNGLGDGTLTRAAALQRIAENQQFVDAKHNQAFVMMEYFGYLRRDPDAGGYNFWLNKLNQFGGNFEQAEMVKAFINSGEYRARFPR